MALSAEEVCTLSYLSPENVFISQHHQRPEALQIVGNPDARSYFLKRF
jgi:hypothetical protein